MVSGLPAQVVFGWREGDDRAGGAGGRSQDRSFPLPPSQLSLTLALRTAPWGHTWTPFHALAYSAAWPRLHSRSRVVPPPPPPACSCRAPGGPLRLCSEHLGSCSRITTCP